MKHTVIRIEVHILSNEVKITFILWYYIVLEKITYTFKDWVLPLSWVWWFNNIKRVGLYSLTESIYFLNAYQFLWKITSLLNIIVIINKINPSYIPSPYLFPVFPQLVTVAKQLFKHSATNLAKCHSHDQRAMVLRYKNATDTKSRGTLPSLSPPCFTPPVLLLLCNISTTLLQFLA